MNEIQPRISDDVIRMRSYLIWEREGRPYGRAMEHWLQARAELEAELRGDPPPVTFVPPRIPISMPPRRYSGGKISQTSSPAPIAARR